MKSRVCVASCVSAAVLGLTMAGCRFASDTSGMPGAGRTPADASPGDARPGEARPGEARPADRPGGFQGGPPPYKGRHSDVTGSTRQPNPTATPPAPGPLAPGLRAPVPRSVTVASAPVLTAAVPVRPADGESAANSFAAGSPAATSPAATSVPAPVPATAPSASRFKPVGVGVLTNAFQITPKVIAGAQPEGEQAFAQLRDLGVKTILSVDGATPDVELAHRYGMRYVHLPIKYEGVTADQGRDIATALEELPGPIYLHCHHGKHRSAAAAAVACVEAGMLDPSDATAVLRTMGTGAGYKGLWAAAREARPLDPAELRDRKVAFVEQAKLDSLAAHMVGVDEHWENVKLVKKAGWTTPADHPDLDPAHEVLQVQEHLHEASRLDEMAARPDDFRKQISAAEADVTALRSLLASPRAKTQSTEPADAAFDKVATDCTSCHKVYRD